VPRRVAWRRWRAEWREATRRLLWRLEFRQNGEPLGCRKRRQRRREPNLLGDRRLHFAVESVGKRVERLGLVGEYGSPLGAGVRLLRRRGHLAERDDQSNKREVNHRLVPGR
jgi:hypothetical protein